MTQVSDEKKEELFKIFGEETLRDEVEEKLKKLGTIIKSNYKDLTFAIKVNNNIPIVEDDTILPLRSGGNAIDPFYIKMDDYVYDSGQIFKIKKPGDNIIIFQLRSFKQEYCGKLWLGFDNIIRSSHLAPHEKLGKMLSNKGNNPTNGWVLEYGGYYCEIGDMFLTEGGMKKLKDRWLMWISLSVEYILENGFSAKNYFVTDLDAEKHLSLV